MNSIDWCVGWIIHVIVINMSFARSQQGIGQDAAWLEGCVPAKVDVKLSPSMIRTKSILGSGLFVQRRDGGLNRFMQREPF